MKNSILSSATKILILISTVFLLSSCEIKDPITPSYDVELNVPIIKKNFTLGEALKKDTTLIKSYTDAQKVGLLYYKDTTTITPILVGEGIGIADASISQTEKITSLTINNAAPDAKEIPISQWSGINPPITTVVPALPPTLISENLAPINLFQKATFETCDFRVRVRNNNNIPITISRIKIIDNISLSTVIDTITNNTIAVNNQRDYNFDLSGKTLNNSLKLEVTISSPGSGGVGVFIPANANTRIDFSFDNVQLLSATAIFPVQDPIVVNSSLALDDSTKFTLIEFSSGSLLLNFENYVDLDLNCDVTFPTFKKANGDVYREIFSLTRRGTANSVKTIFIPDLVNWKITNTTESNLIQYNAVITPQQSSNLRTVAKDDSVSFQFNISEAKLKTFQGRIKPTRLDSSLTTYKIELKNFELGFDYVQMKFSQPQIALKLNTSINFNILFTGYIQGSNNLQTRLMPIPNSTLRLGSNTINLNPTEVEQFLNGFQGKLPDTLVILGKADVNRNYRSGSIKSTDSIAGLADFEFPLNVGIAKGVYKDTSTVSIDENGRDLLNDVLSTSFTLEIENGLPMAIEFKGFFLDSLGNVLLRFPNNVDSVLIPSATVNSSGEVTQTTLSQNTIIINKNEIALILKSDKFVATFEFNTGRTNVDPVKFKTNNTIKLKGFGTLNYRVNIE